MPVIFIGMNQPQLGYEALDPRAPNGAGFLLWQLAHARLGISQDDWRRLTGRTNVCRGPEYVPDEAAEFARTYHRVLDPTCHLVCLGREVADLFMAGDPLEWLPGSCTPGCVAYLPHTSGLNRWYNNPVHWAAASIFIEELWYDRVLMRYNSHVAT